MSKKIFSYLAVFVFGMLFMGFVSQQFNPLSNQLVNAVLWYQRSDEMKAIYLQSYNIAKQALYDKVQHYHSVKLPAVVLDIDETVLDNSPFEGMLIHKGKSYTPELWKQWVELTQAKALPGAVEFTQYAKKLGIEVFYVSNRNVKDLDATIKNLKKQGFPDADSLHVFLKDKTSDKTERFNRIAEKYNIEVWVGDNMGDFSQIYNKASDRYDSTAVIRDSKLWGTKYIVLPNPMYGNWEHTLYPRGKQLSAMDKALIKISHIIGY